MCIYNAPERGQHGKRERQYNKITDPESIAQINPENMALIEDFSIYLQSVDRSPQTIDHYKNDLQIFFVYNLQHNGNKRFTEITKREFVRFQNHALNVWRWSPNRIRVVKSAISSLSNYIENILDEEEGFRGSNHRLEKQHLKSQFSHRRKCRPFSII